MSKDLKTKEGQKSLLNDYLDDLLSNINDSYGPVLLEELQKRLEFTINEFNDEINEAFNLLKQRNDDRKAVYSESSGNISSNKGDNETAWEKKLKEIDNKSN
tara:strand:- start:1258 stop:1563 length:306 start_codon:yes stop_codon:yes gene_type:complete